MAGTESSEKPVFTLRLLVDKKKSKVVLAEAGKEFVDVLFSFMTLPMGTIVRLLEKYQQNQKYQGATIGCFNSLYKSVSDLGINSFMTEPCKDMLLYPRSVKEKQCNRLKLNIDDTLLKYYRCPNAICKSCPRVYSNFCSSRCSCGALLVDEFKTSQGGRCDIFVSDRTLFTITEKMEVGFTSMGLTLKTLKDLGYTNVDQLQEMLVDCDHNKVLALLDCLFSSDTPLTDVFLRKRSSCVITKPSLPLQEGNAGEAQPLLSVSVFTSKLDKKVLYIEIGKDFVDLLFTFLALPLSSAWKLCGSNMVLGGIGNLFESFKNLSSIQGRNTLTIICKLPWYYSCQLSVLDVCYADRDVELTLVIENSYYYFKPMDPRCNIYAQSVGGFVKRGTTFMVSDDLVITPMNLSSNICSLKKWNMGLDDIEEQVINISKAEAIRLLRASFMTSTPLNTVFGSLPPKKPKEEKF